MRVAIHCRPPYVSDYGRSLAIGAFSLVRHFLAFLGFAQTDALNIPISATKIIQG